MLTSLRQRLSIPSIRRAYLFSLLVLVLLIVVGYLRLADIGITLYDTLTVTERFYQQRRLTQQIAQHVLLLMDEPDTLAALQSDIDTLIVLNQQIIDSRETRTFAAMLPSETSAAYLIQINSVYERTNAYIEAVHQLVDSPQIASDISFTTNLLDAQRNIDAELTRLITNVNMQLEYLFNFSLQTRTSVFGALLLVLLFEGIFIFRPLEKQIRQREQALQSQIEERKRIADELAEQQIIYKALFENNYDSVTIISMNDVILKANMRAAEILGHSMDELVGTHISKSMSNDDYERSLEVLNRLLAGEQLPPYERVVKRADGSEIPVEINISLVRDALGKPLHMQSILRDISARKHMEREREERERFIARILETSPDMIFIIDLQTMATRYSNRPFSTVLGYSSLQLDADGTQPVWQVLLHPDDIPAAMQTLAQLKTLQDGKVLETDTRLRHSSGAWRTFNLRNAVFTRAPDGTATELLMIAIDITEQRQALEQSLELVVEREKVQILSDFIRDTSHDFRSPLSRINTNLHLLKRAENPQMQLERIHIIEDQVSYLTRMIEQLHLMSRLDSTDEIDRQPVDLNRLVQNAVMTAQERLLDKGLKLELELDDLLPNIEGDRQLLGLALNTLLDNAILYTQQGKICLRTARVEHDAVIAVEDTGIGIEAEHLPRVFDRFYKANSARTKNNSGTGLGLAMTQRIARLHHGEIEVESTVGEGSTFRLRLPLKS